MIKSVDDKDTTHGAQTVRRAMAILRLLACGQERGVRLTDIVQMSGLNRPTVHRILKALIEEGAVEQHSDTRHYLIGPELTLLGIARTKRFPLLTIADTYLNKLAEQVGDTVFLSVRHGHDSICIGRKTGDHPIQVLSIEVGVRRPLGVGVSGVALLSCLTQEESEAIVHENARRLAVHHLDPQELLERIRTARATDYAYAAAGVMAGTSALAIPVRAKSGEPLAAVTITAMAERLNPQRLPVVLGMMQEQARLIARHHAEVSH
ncbi:IclR family transcriptional regulator [Paralcaligenes sp. KSB-10]|jgi:DNA-binding IclR family transcriptional regulator|uniref:IclR family transcriptional regulator n=1 Tax=Paralcaligenes sp. KSB-10 TaxID=2901142 RepID=UPI001E2C94D7|nr:IclR family transcriptional regulator [Paralcaligenes sp. KSB-10]UHL65096.1 IclR family transcriptional regulator [Paralcaligenes sp. KSB-10]